MEKVEVYDCDWLEELMHESKEEKAIQKEITEEQKTFEKSPEYKEHHKRWMSLHRKLKKVRDERMNRYRAKRKENAKEVHIMSSEERMEFRKRAKEEADRKFHEMPFAYQEAKLASDNLTDSMKEQLIRELRMSIKSVEDIPELANKKTTEKDLDELAHILVQTVIDFAKERNLQEIDGVYFQADGLESSIKEGEWQPATDINMRVEGSEVVDKWPERRIIGHVW